MKVSRLMTLTAVLALAIGTVAYAGPGYGPGSCCGAFQGRPELNQAQQKQANDLQLEFLKKTEPLRTELSRKRLEMAELTSKDKLDEAAIEKKREEIWAVKDKLRNERRAMGKKYRALMTPEQRKKLGAYGFGRGYGLGRGKRFGRCWGRGPGFKGGACPGCPFSGRTL